MSTNYTVFITPHQEAAFQWKTDGDDTIIDPRGNFNFRELQPDMSWVVYVHISTEYFDAMIVKKMITDRFETVLKDIEHHLHFFVSLQNRKSAICMDEDTVEEMMKKISSRTNTVEFLQLDYVITQQQSYKRFRNGDICDATEPQKIRNMMNAKQWKKHLELMHKQHERQRRSLSEQAKHQLTMSSHTTIENAKQLPTFVIEGRWMSNATTKGPLWLQHT